MHAIQLQLIANAHAPAYHRVGTNSCFGPSCFRAKCLWLAAALCSHPDLKDNLMRDNTGTPVGATKGLNNFPEPPGMDDNSHGSHWYGGVAWLGAAVSTCICLIPTSLPTTANAYSIQNTPTSWLLASVVAWDDAAVACFSSWTSHAPCSAIAVVKTSFLACEIPDKRTVLH